jgi:hypothetical protein
MTSRGRSCTSLTCGKPAAFHRPLEASGDPFVGHGRDKLRGGPPLAQADRRIDHRRGQQPHLADAAAGQQRDGRGRGRQVEGGAGFGLLPLEVVAGIDLVGQWVADIGRRNPVALVEGGLEGEQAEHQVGRPADLADPLAAPGPNRGADVVHRADARPAQLDLQPQVEVRRIDADEQVGLQAPAGACPMRGAASAIAGSA